MNSTFNDWHHNFLVVSDFSTLRKMYPVDRITVELTSFLDTKGDIEKLAAITKSMYRAHAEILKG